MATKSSLTWLCKTKRRSRNRYIQSVQQYNVLTRSFPTNLTAMVFSYSVKPSFTVTNEAAISAPPSVSFDKPAAPAASK